MDPKQLSQKAGELAQKAQSLAADLGGLASDAATVATTALPQPAAGADDGQFVFLFTVFVLACFVVYYVVWQVTPALHSPLMAVTNAISSVIIVGALVAAGNQAGFELPKIFGFIAVVLASVNIFGGFIVTERMLGMFKKKTR